MERKRGRMMKTRRACELCNVEAVLHCESDSAYLCWACDARVHGANFLVARHVRRVLCLECGAGNPEGGLVSGPSFLPDQFLCRSCAGTEQGDNDDGAGSAVSDSELESSSCSSSSPSSCVSSAESGAAAFGMARGVAVASIPAAGDGSVKDACSVNSAAVESGSTNPSPRFRRRVRRERVAAWGYLDARAEGVILDWCRLIGLDEAFATGAASHALSVGARRMAAAPFRVVVAAAVWFAAKLCCTKATEGGRRGLALLRRLEACSGVPAKLIVIAENRLSQAVRRRHVSEESEGWAECS